MPLAPQAPDAAHAFHIEAQDGARQVTLDHPMKKEHHPAEVQPAQFAQFSMCFF